LTESRSSRTLGFKALRAARRNLDGKALIRLRFDKCFKAGTALPPGDPVREEQDVHKETERLA
jgi:hypothetical protein